MSKCQEFRKSSKSWKYKTVWNCWCVTNMNPNRFMIIWRVKSVYFCTFHEHIRRHTWFCSNSSKDASCVTELSWVRPGLWERAVDPPHDVGWRLRKVLLLLLLLQGDHEAAVLTLSRQVFVIRRNEPIQSRLICAWDLKADKKNKTIKWINTKWHTVMFLTFTVKATG